MIKDFSAKLIEKKNLADNVWGFTFEIEGDTLEFTAGQYVLLKIDDKFRQYSISCAADRCERFELVMEYFPGGLASEYLTSLPIGEAADFKGPAGVFTLKETLLPKVFLATGTGIAPVKSMVETYLVHGGSAPLYLFFGVKTQKDGYLFDEFVALSQKYPQLTFRMCYSREEEPQARTDDPSEQYIVYGRVQKALESLLTPEQQKAAEYYICGGKEVVEALKEDVIRRGVPSEHIYFERFTL